MPCGQLAFASSTRVPCKARLSRFLNAYEMSTILYGEIPNTHFASKAKVRFPPITVIFRFCSGPQTISKLTLTLATRSQIGMGGVARFILGWQGADRNNSPSSYRASHEIAKS